MLHNTLLDVCKRFFGPCLCFVWALCYSVHIEVIYLCIMIWCVCLCSKTWLLQSSQVKSFDLLYTGTMRLNYNLKIRCMCELVIGMFAGTMFYCMFYCIMCKWSGQCLTTFRFECALCKCIPPAQISYDGHICLVFNAEKVFWFNIPISLYLWGGMGHFAIFIIMKVQNTCIFRQL